MYRSLKTIDELFTDKQYVSLVQKKLPYLFTIAGIESSRAGKIGMEVGSIREKIIIALLFVAFGEKRVNAEFAITATEKDVEVDGKPISIKTVTNNGNIKANWTVDADSAAKWINTYVPKMDIILANICWDTTEGGLFLIPTEVQIKVFKELGREKYLKMPKAGTNPRGVEFSKEAINKMLEDKGTFRISIDWTRKELPYNIYQRWIDYWNE